MDHLLSRRACATTSSVIRDLLHLLERPGIASMAGGLPAPAGFATGRLRDAVDRALSVPGRYGPAALQYGPTEGDPSAREVIATRLAVPTASTIVTTGSQQGLDLVARAVLDPGDVVVVTSPTYLGALQALRTADPRLVAVEADHDGLCTDRLAELLGGGLRPKLCYVVSNFANPTGVTMSAERRRHLAELSERHGFLVVDDDPYGELRFRGKPVEPVRRFGGNVVSLGTASKLLAPGLRVGWLTGPEWLVPAVVKLKQAIDLHTSSLAQLVVADVLRDEPFLAAHLVHLQAVYGPRCDALAAAVTGHLAHHRPDGGMFLWCRARGVDTSAALPVALDHGVAYVPGAAFEVDGLPSEWLRLSYATLTPDELADAGARLVTALSGAPRFATA